MKNNKHINPSQSTKQFPFVKIWAIMAFIVGTLVILDHSGVIDIAKLLKP